MLKFENHCFKLKLILFKLKGNKKSIGLKKKLKNNKSSLRIYPKLKSWGEAGTRDPLDAPLECIHPHSLSRVQLFETPWTVAHLASLSTGLSQQEYWPELPFPPPGGLSNPGTEPQSPAIPAMSGGFFTTEPSGKMGYRAYTWTNVSLSDRIQTNYKGLKITVYMPSWGQIMNKIQKDQKPNCHFETETKVGYCTCTPHEAWTTRQWADHPSHSCSLTTDLPLPSPHLRYQLTTPRRQSEPTCHLFSRPHAVARVPAKTCLNFSSGFWSNSTDSRRSRTLVSNTGTW